MAKLLKTPVVLNYVKYFKAGSKAEIKKEDYSKIVVFEQTDFKNPGYLLQIATIYPNTKQRLHLHDKQTTVLYILSGECLLNINSQEISLKTGDAVICEPGDRHYFWNKSAQNFTFAVFKIDLPKEDDTRWIS